LVILSQFIDLLLKVLVALFDVGIDEILDA
jgi:hypothetical protein